MVAGAALGALSVQVCIPALLLCWFCCWTEDDTRSDASSETRPPRKPVVLQQVPAAGLSSFGGRGANSVVSLHLPSTSGTHGSSDLYRRDSGQSSQSARYHSAPSVILEVLHRRDWHTSAADLAPDVQTIPLHSPSEAVSEGDLRRRCKKHHTNIKRTKTKESARRDSKDQDASDFYIGDTNRDLEESHNNENAAYMHAARAIQKEDKQTLNESIKTKSLRVDSDVRSDAVEMATFSVVVDACITDGRVEMVNVVRMTEGETTVEDHNSVPKVCIEKESNRLVHRIIDRGEARLLDEEEDRSGAVNRADTCDSLITCVSPRISDGPMSYESYVDRVCGAECLRERHCSDGDVLGNSARPDSGAFSESAIDVVLSQLQSPLRADHPLPPHLPQLPLPPCAKETAV